MSQKPFNTPDGLSVDNVPVVDSTSAIVADNG